ncbi:MAG: presqualene diphosphate synthase HpnD [Rhodospirillaceae bacterium]
MGFQARIDPAAIAPADLDAVRAIVRAAGSSFYWAMRFMPQRKREALFAIYAFCREVDDIADGDLSRGEKIVALDRWRQKVDEMFAGRPSDAITRVLADAIQTFGLRRKDFIAVVQGMEMDARGPVVAPSQEELDLYVDCVASAVGRLCVHVFGEAVAGQNVANHLGRALQLTNILRDIEEDAAIGRLYLPREILMREGFGNLTPNAVAHDARLPIVIAAVGAMAERAFTDAGLALASCDRTKMRPAVVMMMVYRRHLDRLRANAWRPLPPRTGLARAGAKIEKLWIALHYGLF